MGESGLICGLLILSGFAVLVACFPFRQNTKGACMLAVVLIILALLGYWQWGGWSAFLSYQQQLAKQARVQTMLKSVKGVQDLILKLKKQIRQDPNSAQGWYLLGRLYSSQNQKKLAGAAFARAYQLNSHEVQYAVNYANSLFDSSHDLEINANQEESHPDSDPVLDSADNLYDHTQEGHRQDEQARQILLQVLKQDPHQPDALAMLAMDAYHRGLYKKALGYWQQLLSLLPPSSAEAASVRKAMARCLRHGGVSLKGAE